MKCPHCKVELRFLGDAAGPLAECPECDYVEPRAIVVHQIAPSINQEFARYYGRRQPDPDQ